MASEALFEELSKALARPSGAYRAATAALEIPQQAVQGYYDVKKRQGDLAEAKLKPYEIYSKIAEQVGPNAANSIFQKAGMTVPDMGTGGSSPSNLPAGQLSTMGNYGKNQLGMRKTLQEIDQTGPRTTDSARSNLTAAGLPPEAVDAWLKSNTDANGMVPNKNYDDFIKAKNTGNAGSRGDYYTSRVQGDILGRLPSNQGPSTAAGAASQVQIASRQGRSLIADPLTSPQRLSLASDDMARAVLRAAPQLDALRGSNFSSNLASRLNQITQYFGTGNVKPEDVPKLRQEMYGIFKDLETSSRPFVDRELQNMESTYGAQGLLPQDWNSLKQRELGLNFPDIPFNPGGANPGAGSGGVQWVIATNPQGIKIRSKDNFATFEPVPPGQ